MRYPALKIAPACPVVPPLSTRTQTSTLPNMFVTLRGSFNRIAIQQRGKKVVQCATVDADLPRARFNPYACDRRLTTPSAHGHAETIYAPPNHVLHLYGPAQPRQSPVPRKAGGPWLAYLRGLPSPCGAAVPWDSPDAGFSAEACTGCSDGSFIADTLTDRVLRQIFQIFGVETEPVCQSPTGPDLRAQATPAFRSASGSGF